MKHDRMIDELRPYLKEPANDSFLKKVHQKDVRKLIIEVKETEIDALVAVQRDPANGDLYFENDQDIRISSDKHVIIQPNHSTLETKKTNIKLNS